MRLLAVLFTAFMCSGALAYDHTLKDRSRELDCRLDLEKQFERQYRGDSAMIGYIPSELTAYGLTLREAWTDLDMIIISFKTVSGDCILSKRSTHRRIKEPSEVLAKLQTVTNSRAFRLNPGGWFEGDRLVKKWRGEK